MRVSVTAENLTVEEAVFRWLHDQTGDLNRAAAIASSGFVEEVLALNPGLALLQAQHGDALPLGAAFETPAIPDRAVRQTIKLWDE